VNALRRLCEQKTVTLQRPLGTLICVPKVRACVHLFKNQERRVNRYVQLYSRGAKFIHIKFHAFACVG